MRIGIPKALLYHKYHVLWETFLSGLGAEVVISRDGTKESYEAGCRFCLDEICLPVKTYYGHVLELIGRVDLLFIPRVVSIEKRLRGRSYTCPKMIGLPDMVRASVPGLPKILSPKIDINRQSEFIAFFKLGLSIVRNPIIVIKAYIKAKKEQEKFEKGKGVREEGLGKRIGIISHSYNLCGAYPAPQISRILERLGAKPLTIDVYPKEVMIRNADESFKELSWNYEREMLGGAIEMIKENNVDGCIIVTNFACGPDSLTGDYILRFAKRHSNIPFTMLTIDEHTGEAGIKTRVEAFLDMIGTRKK